MKLFSKIMALVVALSLILCAVAFAEPKTYIVGTNPEFPPFEYVNDEGVVAGIDVEIIKGVMEKADPGCVVDIQALDFDALVPSLVSGKIDICIAGMTASEERKQSVDFSDPYFQAFQAVIVKEDSPIATEADLAGKKIGVQMGTTGDLYATDYISDAEVNRYNKGIDAVQDVLSNRLDAVVIDDAPASVFVAQTEGLKVLDVRLNSGDEFYAIALAKGSTELQAKINAALNEMKEDGSIQKIIDAALEAAAIETAEQQTEDPAKTDAAK